MRHAERKAKTTSEPKTGLFATLRALLRAGGTGAPSAGRTPKLLLGLAAVIAATLVLGAPAAIAAVAPPTVAIDAPSAINPATGTFAFTGHVNPGGTEPESETTWHFTCSPSCGSPAGATIAPSTSSHLVEAEVEGLNAKTTYTVTLHATNSGGEETAQVSFKTPAMPPLVRAFAAGPVASDQAGINGEVNPQGSATVYWFEWGASDCTSNPCQSVPVGHDADAGSDALNHYVSAHLAGLTPSTTYHFQLVARNAAGTTEGPDEQFTTAAAPQACPNAGLLGSGFLPDCRAWELVSPVDKNGGNVAPVTTRTRAAADGDAVDFASLVGFGDVGGGTIATEYLAQRTAAPGTQGWATHGITPAQQPLPAIGAVAGIDPGYDGEMSTDLSKGVFRAYRPITDAPDVAGLLNYYVRDDLRSPGKGSYRLISDPGFPLSTTFVPFRPFLAGASADFSTVIFESGLNLTADAGEFFPFGGQPKLYENRDGSLQLAGRVPPPGDAECDDSGAVHCEAAPSSQAGQGALEQHPTPHMISSDGSRVFFQAPAGTGNVYARIDGTRTVQLDASERETPEAPQSNSRLWTASADGSRVFFSSQEGLVDEDTDGAEDYYMYDFTAPAGHHLTLISKDGEPAVVDSGLGIVGAGEDGHYLYFMMAGQLVAGEDPLVYGLYVWHDGSVRFIGSFADAFNPDFNSLTTSWLLTGTTQGARVSADGSHLMFTTTNDAGFKGHAGFAGFDHGTACSGGGCQEYYVYDATSGRLRCASCDPSGALPTGRAEINSKPAGVADTVASTSYLNHAISADGRWVFFSSPDDLLSADTNGKIDAYRYDTETETLSLLSSGTAESDSYFMDASASGRDAFFATRQRLSAWDTDSSYDLYDARVGGGLPEPAPVPAACEGDSCRPAVQPAPGAPPVASAQPGPGNPKPPCPKGKRRVHRHGKSVCVKKNHHRHAKHNRRAGR